MPFKCWRWVAGACGELGQSGKASWERRGLCHTCESRPQWRGGKEEGRNDTCKGSGTTAPERPALRRPRKDTLSKAPPGLLGGKASGPGRNESQSFHHRSGALRALHGLLLGSWEPPRAPIFHVHPFQWAPARAGSPSPTLACPGLPSAPQVPHSPQAGTSWASNVPSLSLSSPVFSRGSMTVTF